MARLYGKGQYNGEVLWFDGERLKNVQGPGSPELRFPANLCQTCNNATSQPFDLAYDDWSDYILNDLDGIYRRQTLDMQQALGDDWAARVDDLTRYFVKHIGCRMARDQVRVPDDLVDFLSGTGEPASLRCGYGIRKDLHKLHKKGRRHGDTFGGPWMRPLQCWYSPSIGEITELESGYALGFIEFWYWIRVDSARDKEEVFSDRPQSREVNLDKYGVSGPFA
ncbi:hypothetical protein [Streptomyces mangrovi]|uniref:hypothetical protein n=1 Tax=Streptomyces mangrovi TaxID=1206892 RepID=UPI00399C8489